MTAKHAAGLALVGVLLFVVLRAGGDGPPDEAIEPESNPATATSSTDRALDYEEQPGTREVAVVAPRPDETDPRDSKPAAPAPSACVLEGRVIDADGNPVGFDGGTNQIHATDIEGDRHRGWVRDGRYGFEDLAPGRYWIRMSLWSRGEHLEREVELPPGGDPVAYDLIFPRARKLEVHVLGARGGNVSTFTGTLRHVEAVVMDGDREIARFGPRPPDVVPNPWGRIRLPVGARPRVLTMYGAETLESTEVPEGTERVDLVVDHAKIEALSATLILQVVDADDGAPIEQAYALVANLGLPASPTGHVEIPGCPPGRRHVTIEHSDYAPRDIEVLLSPGSVVDLGPVELARGALLTGRIQGNCREPWVWVRRFDSTTRTVDPRQISTYSGPAHKASFKFHLLPDEYLVEASGSLDGRSVRSRVQLVDLRESPTRQVELLLEPAVQVAIRPEREPLVGTAYRILDDRGLPVASGTLTSTRPRVEHLAPGDYALLADAPGLLEPQLEFRAAGETVPLVVR